MKQYRVKANCAIACNSIFIARGDTAIVPDYFVKAVGSDVTVIEEVVEGEVTKAATDDDVVVEETATEAEESADEGDATEAEIDLSKMNKKELVQAAVDLGIDAEIAEAATKKELVLLIEEKAK